MKTKLLLVLVLIIGFSCKTVLAQLTPVRQWDRTFGGGGYDQLNSLIITSDGGSLAGGFSDSGRYGDKSQDSKGVTDFWIVRLDSNGTKLWDKTLGGPGGDYLKTLIQTSDGGYLLGGWSESGIGADKSQAALGWDDFWVVKVDSAGKKIWDKTYGGSSHDFLYAMKQTPDGNYLLAGMSDSPKSLDKTNDNYGPSGKDFWLLKIDQQGNRLWDKTIGSNQDDVLVAFLPCTDGGFLLGGYTGAGTGGDKSQTGFGLEDYWIVKVDSSGNVLWDRTFGGAGVENLGAMDQTSDGGFLIGGTSDSGISGDKSQASRGNFDFWVLRLDAYGTKIWEKTIGGSGVDKLTGLRQNKDLDFLLVGNSLSGIGGDKSVPNYGYSDYWVVKINSAGTKLWDKAFGSSNMDELSAFQLLPKEALIVAGSSNSDGNGIKTSHSKGNYDYWIIKLTAPCALLNASLVLKCVNGKATSDMVIGGTANNSWTLTYAINGTPQTLTKTGSRFTFPVAWPGGTELTLLSIQSGGCQKTLYRNFTFPNVPDAPVVTAAGICWPESGNLQASGIPPGSVYVWYKEPTGGTPFRVDSTGLFISPAIKVPTLYYVAGRNELGCEGIRTQILVRPDFCPQLYLPNIITQNQDGKNETFTPLNLPEGTWNLQIFNRWGKKIYEKVNYQNTWPEEKMKAGTYYYLLRNAETSLQYKGWLEVNE